MGSQSGATEGSEQFDSSRADRKKMPNKIFTRKKLLAAIAQLKRRGKTTVTTNGVFDLLHVGHVRYLREAKKLGDVLIVAVNSDKSTRILKGSTRPLNPARDRAEVLAALECVDFVTIFNERDPRALLSEIKPHVHVKGGDYKLENLPEREVVEKHAGRVVLIKPSRGYSTTRTIARAAKKIQNLKHDSRV
ncbi:MAG: D-glycero-beta-D-manno-heptose 1-phosphate adenylyltransferase [Patescibacteria group bacterium]|nr:D-glycero-beta-D-manno-heptose 1-phosphate adenylyltransferase [Patescibacteria group bacterium]